MTEIKQTQVQIINAEINNELADPKVATALMTTTFKGLKSPTLMKQAIMEGMIRGFTFKDFMEKNIYALPYGEGYSLITSIDFARKVGMRSGIVGKNKPEFEISDDSAQKIISCTVTVKKMISGYVGDFTATVYFDEFYKKGKDWNGKYTPSMWDKMPRTMIAKVAEMHALRMACPETLSQSYLEEEMEENNKGSIRDVVDTSSGLKIKDLKKGNEKTDQSKENDEGTGEVAYSFEDEE